MAVAGMINTCRQINEVANDTSQRGVRIIETLWGLESSDEKTTLARENLRLLPAAFLLA